MSETAVDWRKGGVNREALGLQTRDVGPPLLAKTEVKRAIEALPRVGWLRLHKIARALSRHTATDPDDLLQEAFQRALNGSRRCPRDLDIVRFLAGTMRSIASDWAKARKRRPEVNLLASTGVVEGVVVQVLDRRPSPDDVLASAQEAACMRKALLDLFADDGIARAMLSGIMDGKDGEDLRRLTGLSETEFASKRRLVRRRIDKAFAKEVKR
jgi:DNA-directed RNA polymerase specialized sigma24 family protein